MTRKMVGVGHGSFDQTFPPLPTTLASADFEDSTLGDFAHGGSSYGSYSIVADPTGAGRGNVARLFYDGLGNDVDSYLYWNPSAGQISAGDTVYSYGRFYLVSNGFTGNRKLWRYYVGAQGGDGSDITIWHGPDLNVEGPDGSRTLVFSSLGDTVAFDTWHELEVQMTLDSTAGAGDGILRIWLNRVLVYENLAFQFTNATNTSVNVIRMGYQTQSTRTENGDLDDVRYWDGLKISTGRIARAITPIFSDGFETGDMLHTENGFEWRGGSASAANPRTGAYAFDRTRPVGSGNEVRFWTGGEYPDLWLDYWLYIPANYWHQDQLGSETRDLVDGTAGSAILTAPAGTFTTMDKWREYDIPGAGDAGATLRARILTVDSDSQVTLDQNIVTSVTDATLTSPSVWTNRKFLILWGGRGEPNDGYGITNRSKVGIEMIPTDDGDSRLRFVANPDGGPTAFNVGSAAVGGANTNSVKLIGDSGVEWPRGSYGRFRYRVSVGSAPGEGIIQAWAGDTLIFDESGLNLYPVDDNSGNAIRPFFDVGYTFGAFNGGVGEALALMMDDVKVYTSDPGWV